MENAGGELFPADRADAAHGFGFRGGKADAAVPVAVKVVLALLGEEFHGAAEALAGPEGVGQGGVGGADVQEVGLPAQPGRGVGVGVGDQLEAVQGRQPPDHGGVGGKAGLQGGDMGRQVLEALLDGVKAGKGSEQGKVGRPDVGGDENAVGAGIQENLQEVAGV